MATKSGVPPHLDPEIIGSIKRSLCSYLLSPERMRTVRHRQANRRRASTGAAGTALLAVALAQLSPHLAALLHLLVR